MFKHVDADAAPWRADFLIGLPIGLRVQRHIAGPLWLEAGASVYLNVPAVFTAARFDFEMASAKADSFHIRPGGGVGLTGGHSTRDWNEGRNTLWLTGDVDFVWRHRWREGVFGEFGFKLGVVAPVGNGDWWFALPRAALICGVQF